MAIWIDPDAKTSYVLEVERELPAGEQTTYHLRPLRAGEYVRFSMGISRDDEGHAANVFEYHTSLLRLSLIGWEGPGAPAFDTGEDGYPTDTTLSRIPATHRWELARAADRLNIIDKATAGKSPSQ